MKKILSLWIIFMIGVASQRIKGAEAELPADPNECPICYLTMTYARPNLVLDSCDGSPAIHKLCLHCSDALPGKKKCPHCRRPLLYTQRLRALVEYQGVQLESFETAREGDLKRANISSVAKMESLEIAHERDEIGLQMAALAKLKADEKSLEQEIVIAEQNAHINQLLVELEQMRNKNRRLQEIRGKRDLKMAAHMKAVAQTFENIRDICRVP